MLYMGPGIELQARMQGGLMKGLMRKFLAGESMFMSVFGCNAANGHMALANPIAGKVYPIQLRGNTILAERNTYLCAIGNVDLPVAFTERFGAGLFGVEGFILQKISGEGLDFLHAGGNMLEFTLAPGEKLRVDTGCIVSLADSADYDIEFVGGFRNPLFGGEGLFYATLTGPWDTWSCRRFPSAPWRTGSPPQFRTTATSRRESGHGRGSVRRNHFGRRLTWRLYVDASASSSIR